MADYESVKQVAKGIIKQYPELRGQVNDLVQMSLEEIDEGADADYEFELCIQALHELGEAQ